MLWREINSKIVKYANPKLQFIPPSSFSVYALKITTLQSISHTLKGNLKKNEFLNLKVSYLLNYLHKWFLLWYHEVKFNEKTNILSKLGVCDKKVILWLSFIMKPFTLIIFFRIERRHFFELREHFLFLLGHLTNEMYLEFVLFFGQLYIVNKYGLYFHFSSFKMREIVFSFFLF